MKSELFGDDLDVVADLSLKGDVSGHAFHGNRWTGGIGGGEQGGHARIKQTPEELGDLGKRTILAKRSEAEKAAGLTHEWGGTNEQEFASNLKRNIQMMYSHAGGLTPARIDSFTRTWARSSTDSVADSVAMQRAIADKFSLPMGKFLQERAEYLAGGYKKDLLTMGQIEDIGRKVKAFNEEANQRLTGRRSEVGQILPPYEAGVEGTQASHDFFEAIRQQDAMLEPLTRHNDALEAAAQNGEKFEAYDKDDSNRENIAPNKVGFAAYQEDGIDWKTDVRNLYRSDEDTNEPFDKRIAEARQYVDAVYERTQAYLKSWGVKYVTLDRGMSLPDKAPGDWTKVDFEANPLSSWSADARVALRFAYHDVTSDVASPNPWWLKATIPVEKVFSLPFSGPGCYNENEIVCIKGDYAVSARSGVEPDNSPGVVEQTDADYHELPTPPLPPGVH